MDLFLATTHRPEYNMFVRRDSPSDLLVIREIWCENVYRVFDTYVLYTKVVIDLGANIGAFSLLCASFNKAIKIYAVEPEPNNLLLLNKNIAHNNMTEQIISVPLAVTDEDNKIVKLDDNHGSTSMLDQPSDKAISVNTITLESLLKKYSLNYVDVLKIDVEGAENLILINTSLDIMNRFRYITLEFDSRNNHLGQLVEKLSETHHVTTLGSYKRGGMVFAKRY